MPSFDKDKMKATSKAFRDSTGVSGVKKAFQKIGDLFDGENKEINPKKKKDQSASMKRRASALLIGG